MFKEWMSSISGNISRRVTNPFLGTFLAVWIYFNWKPLYAILTFGDGYSLQERIRYLDNQFGAFSWVALLKLIAITFGILILTYLLLFVSSLIANFYAKIAKPKVKEWTDKSSVVTKQEYDGARDLIAKFKEKYEEERSKVISLQKQLEEDSQSESAAGEQKDNKSHDEQELTTRYRISEGDEQDVVTPKNNHIYSIIYNHLERHSKISKFIRVTGGEKDGKFDIIQEPKILSALRDYNLINPIEHKSKQKGEIVSAFDVSLNERGKKFLDYCMEKYAESITE